MLGEGVDYVVAHKTDLLNFSYFCREFSRFGDRESSWLAFNVYEEGEARKVQSSFLKT